MSQSPAGFCTGSDLFESPIGLSHRQLNGVFHPSFALLTFTGTAPAGAPFVDFACRPNEIPLEWSASRLSQRRRFFHSGFGCCHNEPAKCGAHLSKAMLLLAGILLHIEPPVNLNHH
jgi:hypothetical protein